MTWWTRLRSGRPRLCSKRETPMRLFASTKTPVKTKKSWLSNQNALIILMLKINRLRKKIKTQEKGKLQTSLAQRKRHLTRPSPQKRSLRRLSRTSIQTCSASWMRTRNSRKVDTNLQSPPKARLWARPWASFRAAKSEKEIIYMRLSVSWSMHWNGVFSLRSG